MIWKQSLDIDNIHVNETMSKQHILIGSQMYLCTEKQLIVTKQIKNELMYLSKIMDN